MMKICAKNLLTKFFDYYGFNKDFWILVFDLGC